MGSLSERKFTEIWCGIPKPLTKRFLQKLQQTGKSGGSSLQTLAHYLASTPAAKWDSRMAWAKMFPSSSYTDNQFNKYLTRLTERLERFLKTEAIHDPSIITPMRADLIYLEYCYNRRLEKTVRHKIGKIDRLYPPDRIHGIGDLQDQMEYSRLLVSIFEDFHSDRVQAVKHKQNYLRLMDCIWAVEKLLGGMNLPPTPMLTSQMSMAEDMLEAASDWKPYPQLVTYLYRVYTGEASAESGWERMLTAYTSLPIDEFRRLYTVLFNLIRQTINLGQTGPIHFFLGMNQYALSQNIFQESQAISNAVIQNQVIMYCRIGALEQAQSFLNKERSSPSGLLDSVLNFCEGLIAYYEQDFPRMRYAWTEMSGGTSYQVTQSTILLCQADFEENYGTSEWHMHTRRSINARTRSIKSRIEGNLQIPAVMKQALLNRIRIFRMFLTDSPDWKKIKSHIDQTHPLNEREWLMRQVEKRS